MAYQLHLKYQLPGTLYHIDQIQWLNNKKNVITFEELKTKT
ncbi:hypothetical protein ACWTWI_09340 [Staphylococcus hominis]